MSTTTTYRAFTVAPHRLNGTIVVRRGSNRTYTLTREEALTLAAQLIVACKGSEREVSTRLDTMEKTMILTKGVLP